MRWPKTKEVTHSHSLPPLWHVDSNRHFFRAWTRSVPTARMTEAKNGGEIIYVPPPNFGQKAFLGRGGGVCVFLKPPAAGFYTPADAFIRPSTPKRVFSGVQALAQSQQLLLMCSTDFHTGGALGLFLLLAGLFCSPPVSVCQAQGPATEEERQSLFLCEAPQQARVL